MLSSAPDQQAMKHLYKSETDKDGIDISYYIEPDPAEGRVKWMFFPHLPKGMCARKGDETQLGSMHDYDRQSYEDFLLSPRYDLPTEIHRDVIAVMNEGRKPRRP